MKTKYIFLLPVLCLALSPSAQTETGSNYIAVFAGPSFPSGDLESKNATNEGAGFAKNGFQASLEFGHHFNEKFGAMAMFRLQENATDEEVLERELQKQFPAEFTLNIGRWQSNQLMAGIFGAFPLGESQNFIYRRDC